jgi:L-amino acid N-acyltransferase YncA
MTIRAAHLNDLEAITQLYAHEVLHSTSTFEITPPDQAQMQTRFQDITHKGLPFLVCERHNEILGFAYAAPHRARAAYLYTLENSIYVSPKAQNQGVGALLLEALLNQCKALGYKQMIAVIGGADNIASQKLHEKAGFEQIGIMKQVGYKLNRFIDCVLMQKAL